MAVILPNNENTYNAQLSKSPSTPSTSIDTPKETTTYYSRQPVIPTYEEYKVSELKSTTPTIPKVAYSIGKKVLSLDVETTGLNPWDYKLIVCSVWDLDEPKSSMVTFASWDEEQLCKDMFDYIEKKEPEVILAFNAKFECRCFVTRAMLYHIKAPWIWSVEWHDMMAMLEGGWKNGLTGTMPAGSEENWLKFFFNEEKPFTIEECFEGIRQGRLDEMIIRNRTCVQGQGDMYQLFMYCQSQQEGQIEEEKPSVARIDEMGEAGISIIKCPVCEAVNEVDQATDPGQCWRCSANLPELTDKNVLQEVVRPIDWSLVGLSGDKLKAAQAEAKKSKKSLALQPTGDDLTGATAMKRLKDLGVKI
jgi:hypothetical protein